MTPPKVAIFYTGGTISMTHSALDDTAIPALSGLELSRIVPELTEHFDLIHNDFGKFPGPHMTPSHCLILMKQIRAAIAAGCSGVVVTHGTDTLEETAFFLDLLHDSPVPIVVVGAMRTSDDLSWDGPVNLFSGCLVASCSAARGRGVMVVMNNTIHAASEVTKSYTEAIDTFVSPTTGPMGIVDLQRVFFYRSPFYRMQLPPVEAYQRVELIEATSGADSLLIDAAVDAGCTGLVIAAMGRGNVPPQQADGIYRALARNVVVVVTSRCWSGRVAPIYGYAGGGAQLRKAGCIFAPWLNAPKARVALSLALAAHGAADPLQEFFAGPK